MSKKPLRNWDRLQRKTTEEDQRYRDVYEQQQLERSRIGGKMDMRSRNALNIGITIFAFFIFYIIGSLMDGWALVTKGDTGISSAIDFVGMNSFFSYCFMPRISKLLWCFIFSGATYGIMYLILKHNLDGQNLTRDMADINQYENDRHVALPEEVQQNFDWFPDVGATSDVQVSSMISHVALSNKGLQPVMMAKRATADIVDEHGDVITYKGEIITDEDGNMEFEQKPMIDTSFMHALFDASGLPKISSLRKFYTTDSIAYNPGNANRDKLSGYDTVADLINKDWQLPYYEPQRPGGAYLVDTAPVNTMVLAITRAGKGQTVIEPTLDMWTRERQPNNMVVNDPKGELLVKYYVRGTVRGFQIVQFNLINAMKTDIYNPLGLAADAAREGDFTKAALYVENIAEVFFPVDGGEDPVWPNAANNAFKRAAYGLIDYYLEEEKELREEAEQTGMDEKVLETKLDEMWGKVTLYNTYQLFVRLTSKKLKSPIVKFRAEAKNGDYDSLGVDAFNDLADEIEIKSKPWEDKPEQDMLALFFNATDMLPMNSMRRLVANANNALRSMGGAEKMMASVYGIAITAMSFFTDPTISTLTSGTPSQNVDLAGMSFPRCLGIRLHPYFVERYHLMGMQARWSSYDDKNFTKNLGKDFYHEDMISREGWAKYYFKGKYEREVAYVKLEIVNPSTGMLIRTFFFQFRKSYQTSLDARYYITDPILGDKIVKNGVLVELRRFRTKDGKIQYGRKKTTFKQMKIANVLSGDKRKVPVETNAIIQTSVRYSEKPKMVFLVTPPHLMKYAKLILILVKQLVDLNFDKSYMTKSNQKPLYKTRFMLDELGNLQSEGHGISGFQTMLSIGLGQEQQFTLILQTLQQLRDVYGDSVDKIVQGNTSNIVFLKSTDDSMLDTLQKMSGTHHVTYADGKTVSVDKERLFMQVDGKVTYNYSTKEEPVISYNDFAWLSPRNSIVLRAGDDPIWNRNETILPMSWRLFKNTIEHAGHTYSLQTIPTLSSALDFDVRKNQPNFEEMWKKRWAQACEVEEMTKMYKEAYGYTESEMEQQDQDVLSDNIMELVRQKLREKNKVKNDTFVDDPFGLDDDFEPDEMENTEVMHAIEEQESRQSDHMSPRFAGRLLSRDNLVSMNGMVNHQLDYDIIRCYRELRGELWKDANFKQVGNALYDATGSIPYIVGTSAKKDMKTLNNAAENPNSKVFADGDVGKNEVSTSYEVTDEFIKFLAAQDSWDFAKGRFEQTMARLLK